MLIITEHTKKRMRERGITKQDIDMAWNRKVEESPLPGKNGTLVYRGYAVGGRIIKIVVNKVENVYEVVTVMKG